MEVILLETFDKLGNIGDIVNVRDGYARNFLIPERKALRANKQNKEVFSKIKNDLIEKNKKVVEESTNIITQIEKKEIIFIRNASDNGQLYGSVSPKDISNYFSEKKINIKPSNINLHTSIKKIGIYDINIKLHADVSCNLKVNVATSEENAKNQKEESGKEKSEKNISKEDSNAIEKNTLPEEKKISFAESKKDALNLSENKGTQKEISKTKNKAEEDDVVLQERENEPLKNEKDEKLKKKHKKDLPS